MTLNDALQECARNTYNTKVMVRVDNNYSGKGLDYATRLMSGLNYALNKVAREKIGYRRTADVFVGENETFELTVLPFPSLRITLITFEGEPITFTTRQDESIVVRGYASTTVSVVYETMYPELLLSALDTVLPIDERYVDPRVLCQYANYQFLSEEGTDYDSARAQVWLGLFSDSFENVVALNRMQRRVVSKYD